MEEKDKEKIIEKICKENGLVYEKRKKIGEGGFGRVFKTQPINNKIMFAIKVIFKDPKKTYQILEENLNFRGRNIVKIIKQGGDNSTYYYYIMECSEIGSIDIFKKYLEKEEKKRVFANPFIERVGDNLIRFFAKQIINAVNTFYQGNLVHYDIKPNNILIFNELQIKLIDFSLLKLITKEEDAIQGGTPGYITPEYYSGYMLFSKDILQKQDYFAIGAVLYYLKYGQKMLEYNEEKDENNLHNGYINSVTVTNLITVAINKIRAQKFQDKKFTDFLIKLIQYKPEDRYNFENIYRNKWLNKNTEEIKKINDIFFLDEGNMIVELQKSDFLIDNKNYFRKNIDNEKDIKNYKIFRRGKFKFGKKY